MTMAETLIAPVPHLLPTRLFPLPKPQTTLAVFHLRNEDIPHDLASFCCGLFNSIVEEGKTYPQEEPYTVETFRAYYFGYDVFMGFITSCDTSIPEAGLECAKTLEEIRDNRPWSEALAGMYYIKPNYVGRSSHMCNAGFVVVPHHRGLRVGLALGRSFLHFGPQLGYRGSVFNLVYKSNPASAAIWDKLGFTRAGLIPGGGRVKTGPNGEEEYHDAIIFYKSFI